MDHVTVDPTEQERACIRCGKDESDIQKRLHHIAGVSEIDETAPPYLCSACLYMFCKRS